MEIYMKNILKLIGLIVLIVFTFFTTDKVTTVIKENDPLMNKIENTKNIYSIDKTEAIIKDNTIIPGLNGRVVNIDKSYKKMKEQGIFNNKLLIYDKLLPDNTLKNNQDKFIIKGNNNKQMISIIYILDNDKYLDKLESIINLKNIKINYFVTYNYLINNSTKIAKMENREVYNYGDLGEYTPDNILFANNLISRITNNNAIYCLTTNYNKKVLNLCKNNQLYTINPTIIVKKDAYNEIKNKLESGSIILMPINNDTVTESSIIIDYIKGKGLKIGGLSELLNESIS